MGGAATPDRIAQILADAVVSGNTRKTAAKYGITDRTVRNYRAQLESDEHLAEIFRQKLDEIELSWRADLVRTRRVALRRSRQLLSKEEDLDKVTNFIKEGGGVGTAREALGLDGSSHHRQRQSLPEAPGGEDAEGEGGQAGSD